jgi:hypothetical protein
MAALPARDERTSLPLAERVYQVVFAAVKL